MRAYGLTPFHRRSFPAVHATIAGEQQILGFDFDGSAAEGLAVDGLVVDDTRPRLDVGRLADGLAGEAEALGCRGDGWRGRAERAPDNCRIRGGGQTGPVVSREPAAGERTSAQRLGDAAEELVASRLVAAGWRIIGRQVRVGRHELDLVAVDPGPPPELVVVEVRWRAGRAFGLGEETFGWRKQRQVRRGLGMLLDRAGSRGALALPSLPARIDLVIVEPAGGAGQTGDGGSGIIGESPSASVGRSSGPLEAAPGCVICSARPRARLNSCPPADRRWRSHARPAQVGAVPDEVAPRRRVGSPNHGPAEAATSQEVRIVPAVSMRQLLEAGVHFGHQTRRWNPKMRPFIFAERNGIHIIDLAQTAKRLDMALAFVRDTVARGDAVLFVGTKKQAQEPVAQEATRAGQPYVNKRWLGGMLTNFVTIKKRIGLLEQLEARQQAGDFDRMPKKEAAKLGEILAKLNLELGGIRKMKRLPGAVFIIDPHRERIAVTECRKLEIPIIGTGDTNVDPDELDYIIPANDDAIRAIRLLCTVVADACIEGQRERSARLSTEPEPEVSMGEPEFEDIPSDELVAALAGGAALSFEPDLDDEDLLPGARPVIAPEPPVAVSEASADEIAAELAREAAEQGAGTLAGG